VPGVEPRQCTLGTFDADDLRLLLSQPNIGPVVVARLAAVGITSLALLRTAGVEATVAQVCAALGNHSWVNRRRALHAALARALQRIDADAPLAAPCP